MREEGKREQPRNAYVCGTMQLAGDLRNKRIAFAFYVDARFYRASKTHRSTSGDSILVICHLRFHRRREYPFVHIDLSVSVKEKNFLHFSILIHYTIETVMEYFLRVYENL